jgi:hypothetical protein
MATWIMTPSAADGWTGSLPSLIVFVVSFPTYHWVTKLWIKWKLSHQNSIVTFERKLYATVIIQAKYILINDCQ